MYRVVDGVLKNLLSVNCKETRSFSSLRLKNDQSQFIYGTGSLLNAAVPL